MSSWSEIVRTMLAYKLDDQGKIRAKACRYLE